MTVVELNPGEKAARAARRRLGLDLTRPVHDVLDIAEEAFDIPVLVEAFGDEHIAGVLLRHADGGRFVAINADFGAVRQRFTLAHELGHVQLGHQPRVDAAADVFGAGRNPQEVEANYFAAEFLAPRQAVVAWLEERGATTADDPAVVARLALSFGIAFPTACYRLERAGAISHRASERLVAELKNSGAEFARMYAGDRHMDSLETLWHAREYPRAPRQTVEFAEDARARGLLDEDEFAEIVATVPELDLDGWLG